QTEVPPLLRRFVSVGSHAPVTSKGNRRLAGDGERRASTCCCSRELYQFDLVELMLPKDPANIFSIRAGFASETWRVSGEFDGQSFAVDDVFAIDVRHGNLSRGDQIVVGVRTPQRKTAFDSPRLCSVSCPYIRHRGFRSNGIGFRDLSMSCS